jgi:hypothetical protein
MVAIVLSAIVLLRLRGERDEKHRMGAGAARRCHLEEEATDAYATDRQEVWDAV